MIKKIINVLISLWIIKVFLGSLPYKFSGASETVHIFSTIGEWMKLFLGNTVGQLFSDYGAYVIGTFEGIVSIVLLIAIISYAGKALKMCKGCNKEFLFAIGGISATLLMAGAVFFHLVTPLGVVVPIGDPSLGQTDGGSLFKAATSILILGLVLFAINGKALADKYNCACLKKIFK